MPRAKLCNGCGDMRQDVAYGKCSSCRVPGRGLSYDWQVARERKIVAHLTRYGPVCPGYGREPHEVAALTGDHITPRSRGGTNEEVNIQVLCRPCNSRKWNT